MKMDITKHTKIVNTLLTEEEVTFTYNNHFIYIQEHSEGGYDGSIYVSEEDFDNDEEPLDGGICETIVAIAAVDFFLDISRDLTLKEERFEAGFIVGSN